MIRFSLRPEEDELAIKRKSVKGGVNDDGDRVLAHELSTQVNTHASQSLFSIQLVFTDTPPSPTTPD